METGKSRLEEFGSTSWMGLILAAIVVVALHNPLAPAQAHGAHVAPPAAHAAALRGK